MFFETKDILETMLAIQNYKAACKRGRGAIFLSIARGKVAEGIDFEDHNGRCVILFGVPFQYTLSLTLRARMVHSTLAVGRFVFPTSLHSLSALMLA